MTEPILEDPMAELVKLLDECDVDEPLGIDVREMCSLTRELINDYYVAWATVEMLQSALTEQREKTLGRVGDIVLPEARKLILP